MDEWFKAHYAWGDILNAMNDEEAATLARAIFQYARTGVMPDVTGPVQYALVAITGVIDSESKKRSAYIEKQRANANARWAKHDATACQAMPPHATACQAMPIRNNNNINNPTKESTSSIPTTVPIPTTVTDIDNSKPLCNSVDIGTPLPGVQGGKRFVPPTLEEVRQYIADNGYPVDPDEFYDRNSSVGWVDKNGNKYKDWKAVVRTWARFRKENGNGVDSNSRQRNTQQGVLVPGATPIKHGTVI